MNVAQKNRTRHVSGKGLSVVILFLTLLLCTSCASQMEASHRKELFAESNAIIIDHTCTDLSKIPEYWLDKAKKLTIYYAHTSHGSQITSGAEFLAQQNPKYNFMVQRTSADHPSLPKTKGAIRMCSTFGNPATFWKSYYQEGGYTRLAAETGIFNYAMFSWCGQQSSNTIDEVHRYLEALDGYEKEYPHMRFIYMTGHTDGRNQTLRRNNEIIREHCAKNNKVLYDFADIESWTPDGTYDFRSDADCDWCVPWCKKNPEDCLELPEKCAHSPNQGGDNTRKFNCVLKGKAFWWMMARLAGWNPAQSTTP